MSFAASVPGFLHRHLESAVRRLMQPDAEECVDFAAPSGEPALASPDSVSWQVFKNPLALFVGGIAAVLLELAEPRVRSGIWEHTSFHADPVTRMRRTGLAAMLTVYGPRSKALATIAKVGRMHARVAGVTPSGEAYSASDPQLLDWVQATAAFGFLEAYSAFVRPLGDAEKDRFYAESVPAARLYGATGAPASLAELNACFAAMRAKLEPSDIVFEFLGIVQRTAILPWPLGPAQRMLVRAGIAILPLWVREILHLGPQWDLGPWERKLVGLAGALADRLVVPSSPASEACRRLGLPANYLYASPLKPPERRRA